MPVWINVRTTPLPRLPVLSKVLITASLDGENRIADLPSLGFFVRSVVLTPDGGTILNPAPSTLAGSLGKFMVDGDLSYARVDPGDVLSMLRHALARKEVSAAIAGTPRWSRKEVSPLFKR